MSLNNINNIKDQKKNWENPQIESILYQHNKFHFTPNEKKILKNLLFKKPPPNDIRIQVRIKIILLLLLDLVNWFRCFIRNKKQSQILFEFIRIFKENSMSFRISN